MVIFPVGLIVPVGCKSPKSLWINVTVSSLSLLKDSKGPCPQQRADLPFH